MIRVLLVEDSPLATHVLQRLLAFAPDIEVVGTATNGFEALELLPALKPDVICTDIYMPEMNGVEFTRHVMAKHPTPILVVSISVEPSSPNVFQMLEAGAVDVYSKPRAVLKTNREKIAKEFASKIRVVAGVHVFRTKTNRQLNLSELTMPSSLNSPINIVVMGASTGGPQVLQEILLKLPANFFVPIVCVQHIGEGFLPDLVKWLDGILELKVREAIDGMYPQAGFVYFASENAHLEFDNYGRFVLSKQPPCDGHCPSVTVTLRSTARCFGASTLAVLLTGMGRDGADGMLEIFNMGGTTIAQDEASCIVYGMPKEAIALGAVQYVLPLEKIASTLMALVKK